MPKSSTILDDSQMVLGDDHVRIVFDGTMTRPQLDHPEGLAFDRDGRLYCGGE